MKNKQVLNLPMHRTNAFAVVFQFYISGIKIMDICAAQQTLLTQVTLRLRRRVQSPVAKYQWSIGEMSVASRSTCRLTIRQPLSVDISTNISVKCRATIGRYNGRYIDRHISADIGRVSVDMSTDISVECRTICRLDPKIIRVIKPCESTG